MRNHLYLAAFFLAPILFAQSSSVFIASISFEGNQSIGDPQLKRQLRLSLVGRPYSAENLKSDLQRVDDAYQDEGFLHVKVGPPDVQTQLQGSGQGTAIIRIPILEGPRYRVRDLSVKNAQVLSPESLIQMCPLQKGQPYSRTRISMWQSKIEQAYLEMGYLRARCIIHETLNESEKTVDCVLECMEGKPYTVGTITIVGDKSIDRLQFKRRLLLSEGGIFNPETLDLSIQYLNRARLYRPIANSDVEIRIDDAGSTVDLTWHVFLREP